MAAQKVTVIWLDGYNQERCRTVSRVVREMPFERYAQERYPSRYTHLVRWLGRDCPATYGADQWWAYADDAV